MFGGHGTLRTALLDAAETILERDSIQALTLRAVARAAGVSHPAPTHHFGDLVGLLSELAATGYARFRAALLTEMAAAGPMPADQLHAMGVGYVRFAQDQPGLFLLMFRSERLDPKRPALREAMEAAYGALAEAAAAVRHPPDRKCCWRPTMSPISRLPGLLPMALQYGAAIASRLRPVHFP